MRSTTRMVANAHNAMVHVLGLAPADAVLVVTDEATAVAGEAFRQAAEDHGCATSAYVLPERHRPLSAVPGELSARLPGVSVVINALVARNDEIPFRVAWIRALSATGTVRCGHCPGITAAMLESGPLDVDYAAMRATGERLIGVFAAAVSARITTPAGTDLTIGFAGRQFHHDCTAKAGSMSNLPCGEIYCAPVETVGDGVLVADGAIGAIGRVAAPVRLTVRGGRVTAVASDDDALRVEVERLLATDAEAAVIGELGIGINPAARIVGNMLEDEKAFRTAHIAFGNNDDFGGVNHSRLHLDFLFHRPTFELTRPDGTRAKPIVDGDFRL